MGVCVRLWLGVENGRHSLGTQSRHTVTLLGRAVQSIISPRHSGRTPLPITVLSEAACVESKTSPRVHWLAFDTGTLAPPHPSSARPATRRRIRRRACEGRPLASASLGQSTAGRLWYTLRLASHMCMCMCMCMCMWACMVLTAERALIVVVARRPEGLLRLGAASGRSGEAAHHRRARDCQGQMISSCPEWSR